jgi:hypothetical protein
LDDTSDINITFCEKDDWDECVEKKTLRSAASEENQGFYRRTFHRLFMYNFFNSFVKLIIIMSN